jgi:predicted nucleic acid-binding protein
VSKYLVDTNVLSEAMKSSPQPAVSAWLGEQRANCFLSVIVVAELEYGIELLSSGRKKAGLAKAFQTFVNVSAERILAFDMAVARRWAVLRAQWQRRGQPLPVLDSMIEATALHWGLTIVTRNTGDFVEAPTLNPWTGARGTL